MKKEQELLEVLRNTYKKSLITKLEMANELSVTTATVDRLRKEKKLSGVKVLGQIMFEITDLIDFIKTNREN